MQALQATSLFTLQIARKEWAQPTKRDYLVLTPTGTNESHSSLSRNLAASLPSL
jgi:hypothetical protein